MTLKWMKSVQDWTNDVRDFTDLTGRRFADQTDALRDKGGQYISFIHIPTGTEVRWKAFLTQFNDSFRPQWKPSAGYGRMDDIQTYTGTKRTIQISFEVPAASVREAKENLQNVSLFADMMYPVFDGEGGAQTIKAAPFIRMKFMNWSQNAGGDEGLLGTLSGFSFAPKLDTGVFQEGVSLYPKSFTVGTSLTVLHEQGLGWTKTQIDGSGPKATINPKGKTTYYKKQNNAFVPQSPSFPYGEKVASKVTSKAADKQLEEGDINKELLKANQGKIVEERQRAIRLGIHRDLDLE